MTYSDLIKSLKTFKFFGLMFLAPALDYAQGVGADRHSRVRRAHRQALARFLYESDGTHEPVVNGRYSRKSAPWYIYNSLPL